MNIEIKNESSSSFSQRVFSEIRPVDVGVILSVPVVLSVVYLLPSTVSQSLVFDYTDPSLWTAFASSFVHLDLNHLLVNLTMYLLIVPVVYLLSVMSNSRRLFYSSFLTLLFAFPFVLSYLNLAAFRPAVGFGFSGIVMAFVGLLPVFLARFLQTAFGIGPERDIAPMFFFIGMALSSILSVRSVIPENSFVLVASGGIALVAVFSAVLYALSAYRDGVSGRSKNWAAIGTAGYTELAAISLVLFLAFPFVAFPSSVSTGGSQLNLYIHLLGYALGFITVYTSVETADRVRPAIFRPRQARKVRPASDSQSSQVAPPQSHDANHDAYTGRQKP